MSHTPIYDELREMRLDERTADASAAHQATIRLVVPHAGAGNVNKLSSRGGLGGRHRRAAS
ncbi:MAG: hypothetical protein ACT4O0_01240 [Pseudonocardia sp.]